jgi:hypothetical protein
VPVRRVRRRPCHKWKDCVWRPSVLCGLPVLRLQGPVLGQWEGGMRGADWVFIAFDWRIVSLPWCHSKNLKTKT